MFSIPLNQILKKLCEMLRKVFDDANAFFYKLQVYNWLVPDNEEVAQEEADHLFAGSDDDHDSFLR